VSAPSRASRALAVTALALGALAAPATLRGQSLEATLGPYALERRLEYHGEVYDQTGTVYGGTATLRWGAVMLDAGGWTGALSGREGLPNGDVRVRTTAASLHLAVTSAILVGAQVETRRFASEAGVVIWQMRGWDVLFHPELGLPGLQGVAEVSILSSSTVRGGPTMDVALQTTMGVAYSVRGAPLLLRLAYRFERYDLPTSGASSGRLEQFRGVVAEVGLHVAVHRTRAGRR
jgi:hypothetical protein